MSDTTPEMNDFKREDRYRVYKLTDIEAAKQLYPQKADDIDAALALLEYTTRLNNRTCCVVEADWRCYEDVWSLVEIEYNSNAWTGEAES